MMIDLERKLLKKTLNYQKNKKNKN